MTESPYTAETIADLTAAEIGEMPSGELAVVAASASSQFPKALDLRRYDRSTLTRMVYLARHCCQKRLTL